jgi:quinoprotein glucose dehydrogenase
MNRRNFLLGAAALLPAAHILAQTKRPWEWRSYSADAASSRYSPLDQITAANVEHLEVAWELATLPPRVRPQGTIQCTPIVVDGVMYVTAYGLNAHAIEAHTGKLIWSNDGVNAGPRRGAAGNSRGVTYWKDGSDERIFAPVREHILAMDAKTGKLIDRFGSNGAIELANGLDRELSETESIVSTTPGVVFEDLLIITSRPGEGPVKSAGSTGQRNTRTKPFS